MFKNVRELKKFIQWCKAEKLRKVKIDNLEFEVSELGLSLQITEKESEVLTKDLLEDKQSEEEEDKELLYWSSGPQKF